MQAAIFAALLWLVAFICYVTPDLAGGTFRPESMVYLASCAAVGFALSMTVFFALRAAVSRPAFSRICLAGATVPGALLVHAVFDTISYGFIMHTRIILGPSAAVSGQTLLFVNNMLLLTPVHVTFAVTMLLGFSLRAIGDRERRLSAALQAAQEAQLSALRLQINPHFLFNSLNAVTALVAAGRNGEAESVISRLAAFFRASLSQASAGGVTLREEFDMLASYLDIEMVRLGERLNVIIDLPPALARAMVPHFLLQPLVENAVKHAVMPSARPVTIEIRARQEDGLLLLEVSDDGTAGGQRQRGTGVGLANVRARLQALHGREAALKVAARPDGFTASIRLPFDTQYRRIAS